jgi:hypothetical protein
MNSLRRVAFTIIAVVLSVNTGFAQQKLSLGDNAALRYWSAFAQMQDAAISDEQAKGLAAVLDGTAPFDDQKYKELVEKNIPALNTMTRGTDVPNCDWGVESQLGEQAPVDYVRKALSLGRLNVLYAFHLLNGGDSQGATRALSTGLRFSRDLADGGTLFATVAAKNLLVGHLNAISFALSSGSSLSGAQRSMLKAGLTQLGRDGLDWRGAMKRELEIPHGLDSGATASLAHITPLYLSVLSAPNKLPELQEAITDAPRPLPEIVPNPKRVLDANQDLTQKLMETNSLLR